VIDDLNILEATMEAMRQCTNDVRGQLGKQSKGNESDKVRRLMGKSLYLDDHQPRMTHNSALLYAFAPHLAFFAIYLHVQVFVAIDGNRLPRGIDADSNVSAEVVSLHTIANYELRLVCIPFSQRKNVPASNLWHLFLRIILIHACTQIVKGDSKVFSIAAASILAKVTRDRLMNQHAETYPKYGFDQHKVRAATVVAAVIF